MPKYTEEVVIWGKYTQSAVIRQATLKQFPFTGWRTRASSSVCICSCKCVCVCMYNTLWTNATGCRRPHTSTMLWTDLILRPVHTAAYLYIRSPVYCLFISNFDCNSGSCSRKPNLNWYKLPSVAATAVYVVLVVCPSFRGQIFFMK